jgi:tetratricopeptide (TPR) repeat protein
MVWPDPLLLYRDKPTFFQQWISIAAQLVLLVTAFLQARARRYGLCAGLVFFYLALVPSSRLVGIGGMSSDLAERYLYFPSVGLAISLASGFRYLALRRGPWLSVVGAVTALALLTPLTWNRNYDWANEVRLFESEYLNGSQGRQTLRLLTAAYLREGMPDRAAEICDTKSAEQKFNKKYASHCAIAYMQTGRNEDAERAFLKAASGRSAEPAMHTNLAVFYLRLGRRQEAIDQFELAIQAEDNPALQAYRRGEMLVLLYPRNRQKLLEARSHFRQAVQLQPRLAPAQEWLDRLNRKLGPRRKS